MMAILIALGMFIGWTGIVSIVVPIYTPIAHTLQFVSIWFVMLAIVNFQISFLSPPFVFSTFFPKAIAPPEITTLDIDLGTVPFVGFQMR